MTIPTVSGEQLLTGLDPEQHAVATCLDGAVRVLAGAGTGKTRAITHRIAYAVHTGACPESEILAVTFTTRAAGEMRTRLAELGVDGVQARTFHSAALRQARFFWPQIYDTELPRLVESKLSMVAEAVSRSRLKASPSELRDLASEVEWAKVSNVSPDSYPSLATAAGRQLAGFDVASIAQIYRSYEDVKADRHVIDMEDTLLCAVGVLSADDRVASQFRRQYQSFVVDEFQDVSPLQFSLLRLWLGERSELCVVGDPAQTIYSFAGARADYLLHFTKTFPGSTSIELTRNYRSTPEILAAANQVMSADTRSGAVTLRPTRASSVPVTFHRCGDEVEEAELVANEIAALVSNGVAAREIAVLFRVNALSENFEEELTRRSVPFVVRGTERFFERREVREAVTLLRVAARIEEHQADLVASVQDVLSTAGWTEVAPAGRGRVRDRWESLQAIVKLAADHASAASESPLSDFVAELDRRMSTQQSPATDGVTLATLHSAKGLEWSVVFLVGVTEGTLPISYADTPAAVAEERRLFYVGMTRARDRLSISWAAARNAGGRASRIPSRFLDGLVDSGTGTERRTRRGRGAKGSAARTVAHCRVCARPLGDATERKLGRCVDCPVDYDEALFESLRAWRRERAMSESVPAYCVFTDATLTALAEMRPVDPPALIRVPGIGQTKLDKYGDEVLALVNDGAAIQDGHGSDTTPRTPG